MNVIGSPQAVHDPHAMVVLLRNTYIADAAMFASSRLDKMARATDLPWVKEDMVIRVVAHLLSVVLGSNYGRNGGNRFVDKDIGNKA